MGPMQMKLLNEIEKSMRLKENGMNIASVVTLQEACVEAARDVNEYISPLCERNSTHYDWSIKICCRSPGRGGGARMNQEKKWQKKCKKPYIAQRQ